MGEQRQVAGDTDSLDETKKVAWEPLSHLRIFSQKGPSYIRSVVLQCTDFQPCIFSVVVLW